MLGTLESLQHALINQARVGVIKEKYVIKSHLRIHLRSERLFDRSLDFEMVVELKVEIDWAMMSSNMSGDIVLRSRTTMAYTAVAGFSTRS